MSTSRLVEEPGQAAVTRTNGLGGERFVYAKVPAGTRVLYPRPPLPGFDNLRAEVEKAIDNPIGMDLSDPQVDFAGLAKAMGVPSERITQAEVVPDALRRALAARGPTLLDVQVDGRVAK